jgi:hypothetical protein
MHVRHAEYLTGGPNGNNFSGVLHSFNLLMHFSDSVFFDFF